MASSLRPQPTPGRHWSLVNSRTEVTSRTDAGLPWVDARGRRGGPLHRWLMDGPATSALPARPSARPQRDARRAPAVLKPRRSHDLDLPGVRCGGVWAAATCRLPRPRRPGRGALGARRATRRSDDSPAHLQSLRSAQLGGGPSGPGLTWAPRPATVTPARVASDTNVKEVVRTMLRRKMMISPFCAGSQAGHGISTMQLRLRLPSLGYANGT